MSGLDEVALDDLPCVRGLVWVIDELPWRLTQLSKQGERAWHRHGKKDGRKPVVEDPGAKIKQLAVAGEDKKWVWAEGVMDGATLVVSSPAVAQPVAVRYAFSMNPEGANLYNREGLPASPFRTDDW